MLRFAAFALSVLAAIPTAAAQESRPVTIRGRVIAVGTDAPPAGTTVQLREGRRTREGRAVELAPDGRFEVTVPRPATYTLVARAPGFVPVFLPVTAPAADPVSLVLERGGAVRGRVVDGRDRAPIRDARVTTGPTGGEGVLTDQDGRFTLDGLPPDEPTATIGVRARGFAFQEATLRTGTETAEDIALEPGWVAAVRVQDEHGQPLPDTDVRARLPLAVAYSNVERQDFAGRTGADGIAVVEGLPPGQPICFEVGSDALVPTQSPVVRAERPDKDGGPPIPAATITAGAGTWATIRVQDEDGNPIPGAEVHVRPLVEGRLDVRGATEADSARGPIRDTTTADDGTITLNQLPRQLLTVEVRAEGWLTQVAVMNPGAEALEHGIPEASGVAIRLEPDPSPPGTQIPWEESVTEALRRSHEASLPIFIALAMDGEAANDWMAVHHFHDREVVRVLQDLPVLLASVFGEGGRHASGVEHGEVDGVCSRYGLIACRAHQEAEAWARPSFIGSVPFQVPRHIVVGPDGNVLFDRTYYLGERDLCGMALRAWRQCAPEVAVKLAADRFSGLWHRLSAPDEGVRVAAREHFVALVNSGDEWAIALLIALAESEVPAADRLAIADGLLLEAITHPASALQGFVHDPDPAVREHIYQRLGERSEDPDVIELLAGNLGAEDGDARVALLQTLGVREADEGWTVDRPAQPGRWRMVTLLLHLSERPVVGQDEILAQPFTPGFHAVVAALAEHPGAEGVIAQLTRLASAADPSAVSALRALDPLLGPDDELADAVKVVFSQLQSPSALVRQEAARVVGHHAEFGDSATLLEKLSADPSDAVRTAAAIGQWTLGVDDGAALVLAALDNPEFAGDASAALMHRYLLLAPSTPGEWQAWMQAHGIPVAPATKPDAR